MPSQPSNIERDEESYRKQRKEKMDKLKPAVIQATNLIIESVDKLAQQGTQDSHE